MNNPASNKTDYIRLCETFAKYHCKLQREPDTLTNRIMKFRLECLVQEGEFQMFIFPMTHQRGWHLWVGKVSVRDFCQGIIDTIANFRHGIQLQKTHPKEIVHVLISQCRRKCREHNGNVRIIHSLKQLLMFLQTEYLPHCRKHVGLHSITADDRNYQQCIINEVTVLDTPLTIFRFGLISLSHTIRRMNIEHRRVSARMRVKERIGKQKKQQDVVFGDLPPHIVETVSDDYSPMGSYHMGADGVGRVILNRRFVTVSTLASVLVHEAVPGHHLEFCVNSRRWAGTDAWLLSHFPGYIEGWALYAETLVCKGNPLQKFRQLEMEMLRDVRMIVDTGMHSHFCGKWTYQECKTFMSTGMFRGIRLVKAFRGLSISRKQIKNEVLNICARPGYGISYKVGKFYFEEIRKMAANRGMSTAKIHEVFLSQRVPLINLHELFHKPKEDEGKENNKTSLTETLDKELSPIQRFLMSEQLLSCCGH